MIVKKNYNQTFTKPNYIYYLLAATSQDFTETLKTWFVEIWPALIFNDNKTAVDNSEK